MQLIISPKIITLILTGFVLFLMLASTAGQFSKFYLGRDNLLGLVGLFYINGEGNIPSWFSSSILLLSAILLAFIYLNKKKFGDRFATQWGVLALGFIYLSMDEASRLHERLGEVLSTRWVIPFALAGAVILPWYLRFIAHLPARTRLFFILAGIIYVAGAMGMELVGWKYQELYGTDHFGWKLVLTLEEFLEMIGIVTFIYALTEYMRTYRTEDIAEGQPSVVHMAR